MYDKLKRAGDFVDLKEALTLCGLSREELFNWIKEEKLTGWKVAGEVKFYRNDILELLKAQNTESHEDDELEIVYYRCFA
jgi:hypothetical protein